MRGAPGPVGPVGATGTTGALGGAGGIGPAGVQGTTGPIGQVGPKGPQGVRGVTGPIGRSGPTGAKGSRGIDGVPPIYKSSSLDDVAEVALDHRADVVVVGSVAARTANGGTARIRIGGESFVVDVPGGGERHSIPLSAGATLDEGRWSVELIAGDGVELKEPSVSIMVEAPANVPPRDRAARH